MQKDSYFPLLIEVVATGEVKHCPTVESLPDGIAFKVLRTNADAEDTCSDREDV